MALGAKRQWKTRQKHKVSHFYFYSRQKMEFMMYFVYSHTFSYKFKVQWTNSDRVWAACEKIGQEIEKKFRHQTGQEVGHEIGHKNGKEIWQEKEQKVRQKIGQGKGHEIGHEIKNEIEQEIRQTNQTWNKTWNRTGNRTENGGKNAQKLGENERQEIRQKFGQNNDKLVFRLKATLVSKDYREQLRCHEGDGDGYETLLKSDFAIYETSAPLSQTGGGGGGGCPNAWEWENWGFRGHAPPGKFQV